jgi:hypothetical protein
MKRFVPIFRCAVLYAALFLIAGGNSIAQNLSILSSSSLRVADPRGNWNRQGQGRIDEALLTLTPCGVYTQCDLFLTFSSRGTTLNSVKDTLEVQFDFALPQEAHITDSWLWVGDSIVSAKIFDRTSATTVYEAIVQRRRDPSLLTKNYGGYFSLRIFPMLGNETRKVKISYLLPSEWIGTSVYAALPISILKASSQIPHLGIIYYPHNDWTVPRLALQREHGMGTTVQEILRETRELQTGRKVFAGTVPNTVVRDNIAAALTFDSPSQNGVFVQTFSREGEQFYHLTLNARQLLGVGASDSVEIDNLRLSSSTGACYDRYTLNLPPVYTSYYYGGFTPGFPSTRPAVGLSSYYTPYYTFRGTQRLDKNGIMQEVGRFSGSGGLTLRLGGYVNNVPFGIERTIPASAMRQGGDCGYSAWMGNYLAALENEPMRYGFNGVDTAWQARQKRIVKLSVENRVLSRLTAFLALEPNDTTRVCATCTQPTTGNPAVARGGAPVDAAAASSFSRVASPTINSIDYALDYLPSAPYTLAVAPNPSKGAVTLTLSLIYPLDTDANSIRAGIYDALGHCVRIIPASVIASWLKQGQIHVLWDGDDDSGRRVSQGVYFLMVQTPTARRTAKIMRWD